MTPTALRALRRRLRVTQARLAAEIGVAPNTVARWERGELGMRPATAKLIRILASTMTSTKKEKR
jgi:DNA-binding transcriptional regulator YiaG